MGNIIVYFTFTALIHCSQMTRINSFWTKFVLQKRQGCLNANMHSTATVSHAEIRNFSGRYVDVFAQKITRKILYEKKDNFLCIE